MPAKLGEYILISRDADCCQAADGSTLGTTMMYSQILYCYMASIITYPSIKHIQSQQVTNV